MENVFFNHYGLVLIFLMGLRHGLDPDHIAIIDSMGIRLSQNKNKIAPWVGTFFALGHGFLITLISVLLCSGNNYFKFSESSFTWIEWLPITLLFTIGCINLNALLKNGIYKPVGWRVKIIPKRLLESSNPLSFILVGILFALVFDTATQAAVWGYAASSSGSILSAVLIGAVFTAGMVITDTIDSRLLYQIYKNASTDSALWQYRRTLGWLIVVLSFAIVLYKISSHFYPIIELSDTGNLIVGSALVAIVALTYLKVFYRLSKISTANGH